MNLLFCATLIASPHGTANVKKESIVSKDIMYFPGVDFNGNGVPEVLLLTRSSRRVSYPQKGKMSHSLVVSLLEINGKENGLLIAGHRFKFISGGRIVISGFDAFEEGMVAGGFISARFGRLSFLSIPVIAGTKPHILCIYNSQPWDLLKYSIDQLDSAVDSEALSFFQELLEESKERVSFTGGLVSLFWRSLEGPTRSVARNELQAGRPLGPVE